MGRPGVSGGIGHASTLPYLIQHGGKVELLGCLSVVVFTILFVSTRGEGCIAECRVKLAELFLSFLLQIEKNAAKGRHVGFIVIYS